MSIKLLVSLACLGVAWARAGVRNVDLPFLYHEIVPDVLTSPPDGILKVIFPSGVEAQLGKEVPLGQVTGVPALAWEYSPDLYYTLIFCDPDTPSRSDPTIRSVLHWLVVNIPGNDVDGGETITSILNSAPTPGTGLHRYLFVVFQQPVVVEFEELPDDSVESRIQFSVEDFVTKYNLGTAVAGNFYQTQNLTQIN